MTEHDEIKEWVARATSAGETLADCLGGRSSESVEISLAQFELDMLIVFADHSAPDPEGLADVATAAARCRLEMLRLH
jgi:hypothetical protein